MTFGQRLRTARENARLTLRETAREAGISVSYLSDIELGKRGIPEALDALATALGLQPDTLREWAGEPRVMLVAGCSSCPWSLPARGTDGTCGLDSDERECDSGDDAPDWCPLRSRDVLVRLSTEAT